MKHLLKSLKLLFVWPGKVREWILAPLTLQLSDIDKKQNSFCTKINFVTKQLEIIQSTQIKHLRNSIYSIFKNAEEAGDKIERPELMMFEELYDQYKSLSDPITCRPCNGWIDDLARKVRQMRIG